MMNTLGVSQNNFASDTPIDFQIDFYINRFNTAAGNHVKKILLKLNLSDHRKLKDGGEVTCLQLSYKDP
ncbi:hypothetical protein Tco_0844439 [Tanacetum coccineum]